MFRKIRQTNWLDEKTGQQFEFEWLAHDEIPADPLADFPTKNGALSIYVLEDDSEELVRRVAAAIAATSSSLSNVDYAIIELEQLDNLGFKMIKTPATTPDMAVNDLHCDLVELSATALVRLVTLFWHNQKLVIKRVPEKTILQQIVNGVRDGYVEESKIKITSPKLLEELGKVG